MKEITIEEIYKFLEENGLTELKKYIQNATDTQKNAVVQGVKDAMRQRGLYP